MGRGIGSLEFHISASTLFYAYKSECTVLGKLLKLDLLRADSNLLQTDS
jgi:hypothetical protein